MAKRFIGGKRKTCFKPWFNNTAPFFITSFCMHKKGTAVHEHGLLSQWRGYARGVEEKLLAFYGVGPVTLNIFLREMRPFWTKADPRSAADCQKTGETSLD